MPIGQAKFGLLGGVPDLGKLELIETKIHSSDVPEVDFTDIKEDIYNVHFMTEAGDQDRLIELIQMKTAYQQ